MDPDAPVIVLKGLLATCSAGGILGGVYGIAKRQPPLVFAVNSSVNSGIAGLTFFALREYIVGPALVHTVSWETYARRRGNLRADTSEKPEISLSPPRASFSEMRSEKLLDTAIAGSATGGILNSWKRGPPGIAPGAVTAGIICTAAQFLWNELKVTRVKYLSRSIKTTLPEPVTSPEHQKTFSEKLMDGLGLVLPIKKISDEEYLQKLLREKREVERRLEAVQKDLKDAEHEEST